MKIICLEEHTIDAMIAQASQTAQIQEAGYTADLTIRVDQDSGSRADRPDMNDDMSAIATLAADIGSGRIADMDLNGIDMQILSHSNMPQLAPLNRAADLTRAANDRLAEAVHAHPTRFGGFATLPWQQPEATARELGRAVSELGLKGTLITGRPGATFLDDERYRPVLAKLDELQMPLYLHPGPPLPQVRDPTTAASIRRSARACHFLAGAGTTRQAFTSFA